MQEPLVQLAQLAHEASEAAIFQGYVLDFFARHVGFDAAFFGKKGDRLAAVGLDPALLAGVSGPGNPYLDELAEVRRAAMAGRGVAVDTEVLGASRVEKTRYFRDFARPVGGRHTMLGCLSLRGHEIGGLMLGRAGGAFRERDVRFVEETLPTLAVALASFGLPSPEEPALPAAPRRWRDVLCGRADVVGRAAGSSCEIVVRDRGGYREMVARSPEGEMVWSRASLSRPSESGWPYIELFHVAAALASRRCRALFVGCGGAVALRQFSRVYPGLSMDLVESEAAVVELARAHFALDTIPGVCVHIDDGAAFIARQREPRWDTAIVDAYGAASLAPGFDSDDFFRSLHGAIFPGGTAAINVIGPLAGPGLVRRAARSMRRFFGEVRALPVIEEHDACSPRDTRNVVLIARRSP